MRNQLFPKKTIALTISATLKETAVFVDNKLIQKYPVFSLLGNNGITAGKVIIANNMYGTEPWRGSIKEIAIYDQSNISSSDGLPTSRPVINYNFGSYKDEIVLNQEGLFYNLVVPHRFIPLERLVFAPIHFVDFKRKNTYKDIVWNIIGFMPVSFFFVMMARKIYKRPCSQFICVVFLAFLFSSIIETVQVYLPSRNSSQLDVLSNTCGGMFVALFFWIKDRKLDGPSNRGFTL